MALKIAKMNDSFWRATVDGVIVATITRHSSVVGVMYLVRDAANRGMIEKTTLADALMFVRRTFGETP